MAEPAQRSLSVGGFIAAGAPLLLVASITLLFLPSMEQLSHLWTELGDAGYGHGPLLVVVCAWLLWQAGGGRVQAGASRWAWAAVLGGLTIAWAAALASSTSSIGLAIWPAACWVALAFVYGARHVRRYVLPLGLLYFALPVWGPLTNFALWPLTIKVASTCVQWLGLNAYVDRNFITIPSGQFEIIAGCSGQHFFLVATVMGLLIAHLNDLRGRSYWTVVLGSVVAALVTNWVRVISIVVVGYYTEMQHPIVAEGHLLFGWILFAAVIVTFCVWARWYVRRLPDQAFAAPLPADSQQGMPLVAAALIAALVAGVGPVWYALARAQVERIAGLPVEFALPVGRGAWVGPVFADSPLKPEFAGAVLERRGSYVGSGTVHVFANLYTRQAQGAELVGYGNVVLGEAPWRLATLAEAGSNAAFHQVTLEDSAGQRWLVRHAYVVDGRPLAGEMESKIALGVAALAMRAPRSGLVAVAAPCGSDCGAAASGIAAAWNELIPELLTNYLGKAQG